MGKGEAFLRELLVKAGIVYRNASPLKVIPQLSGLLTPPSLVTRAPYSG